MRAPLVLSCILMATVAGSGAMAGPREFDDLPPRDRGARPPDAFLDHRSLTPAQAAREAQSRYGGGRVLSVDRAGEGFRVKLLRDGDVRVVFIPDR